MQVCISKVRFILIHSLLFLFLSILARADPTNEGGPGGANADALSFMDIDFHEGDGEDDQSCCRACHATAQTPSPLPGGAKIRMINRNKCEFCHGVHMTQYGELTFKETHPAQVY